MEIKKADNQLKQKTIRPGWGNYFKEFLMLFLAVFCGYLAEDFRENHQEKEHAEALARSFYLELKEDSTSLEKVIQLRLKRDSALGYLQHYFKDSSLSEVSSSFPKQFVDGTYRFSITLFHPQNVLLEQIRHLGSAEFFQNEDILKLTGRLSAAGTIVQMRNETERAFFRTYIMPVVSTQMDTRFFDTLHYRYKNSPLDDPWAQYEASINKPAFSLLEPSAIERKKFANQLWVFRDIVSATRNLEYLNYSLVNQELMAKLREVYGIQDQP